MCVCEGGVQTQLLSMGASGPWRWIGDDFPSDLSNLHPLLPISYRAQPPLLQSQDLILAQKDKDEV